MNIKLAEEVYLPQRVFCIGRNYAAHIKELKNQIPEEPVIFLKPATALVSFDSPVIRFPTFGNLLHHEVEIVVLIGKTGKPQTELESLDYIAGLSVGFDLTMRDVQDKLRNNGLPWEKSKSFDYSAPIGGFTAWNCDIDLNNLSFSCTVNGAVRQTGNTGMMLFSIPRLLIEIARYWELLPGDLIFTGTPAGVGIINPGDTITAVDFNNIPFSWNFTR